MSQDDRLRSLLDEATARVPARYRQAPLVALRRRIRRRRWTIRAAAAGAVMLAISAPVLVIAASGDRGVAPPIGPPADPGPSASVPAGDVLRWQQARADRAETTVTVFLAVPQCVNLADLTVQAEDTAEAVVLTVRGRQVGGDCDVPAGPTATVRLPAPLGSRPLRDASDGSERRVFRDSQLPILPAGGGWRETTGTLVDVDGTWSVVAYTRSDGPGVVIRVGVEQISTAGRTRVGEIMLGSRRGVIYHGGTGYNVFWQVGDLHYMLRLDLAEGQSTSLAQFRKELGTFAWSG
jgi:hypothetical protein